MKKLTIAFACILSAATLTAQKKLTFKQVKLVTISESVPAGHVWKVEAVGTNNAVPPSDASSTTTPAILVNGTRAFVGTVRSTQSGDFLVTGSVFFPIWLPAGTTLAVSNTINFISVIEYLEEDL